MTAPVLTTKQKVIKLRELSTGAGKNLYQRCKLLSEILADNTYIDSDFDGNEQRARDFFKREYFSDIDGKITLDDLIHIYRAYPDEKIWAGEGYMLGRIAAKYFAEFGPSPGGKPERTNWKAVAADLQADNDALRKDLERTRQQLDAALAELKQVKHENAVLSGRIIELERRTG